MSVLRTIWSEVEPVKHPIKGEVLFMSQFGEEIRVSKYKQIIFEKVFRLFNQNDTLWVIGGLQRGEVVLGLYQKTQYDLTITRTDLEILEGIDVIGETVPDKQYTVTKEDIIGRHIKIDSHGEIKEIVRDVPLNQYELGWLYLRVWVNPLDEIEPAILRNWNIVLSREAGTGWREVYRGN